MHVAFHFPEHLQGHRKSHEMIPRLLPDVGTGRNVGQADHGPRGVGGGLPIGVDA